MVTLSRSRKSVTEAKLDAAKAAADSAIATAEAARAKAVLQAAVLKEKFGPQLEQGLTSTLSAAEQARQWAAPHMEATSEKVGPAVSAAKERFAEQIWPKVEEALTAAAVTGAAAATQALHKAAEAAEAAAELTASVPDRVQVSDGVLSVNLSRPARHGRKRTFTLITVFAAAAALVALLLKRRADSVGGHSWEYVPPLGDPRIDALEAEEAALDDAIAASELEDELDRLDTFDDLTREEEAPEPIPSDAPAEDPAETATASESPSEVVAEHEPGQDGEAEGTEAADSNGARRTRRKTG